jgi:hypothetical protein
LVRLKHETFCYEQSYVQVTKKAANFGGFFVPDDVAKLTLLLVRTTIVAN